LENTKQLIKQPSIIFLLSELWIHCAPLTWQEQEDFGSEAHFGALPETLYFCACLGWKLDRNSYFFTVRTGEYWGSENS